MDEVATERDKERGGGMNRDQDFYRQGKLAMTTLMRMRQRGTYHVIRDPEGVITMWAIEGEERKPFALSFADRGRISADIEKMSPEFVRAFVEYVRRLTRNTSRI